MYNCDTSNLAVKESSQSRTRGKSSSRGRDGAEEPVELFGYERVQPLPSMSITHSREGLGKNSRDNCCICVCTHVAAPLAAA